jgi:lipoate-protein ligase A
MIEFPHSTWRLIHTAATDGATNMATDEAILRAVAANTAPPTLRLFAWEPPCLSLGRNQQASDVNHHKLAEAGFDLVRRPTGGQAILHIDELTYSISLPTDDPRVRESILETCQHLSQGLIAALQTLEVESAKARQHQPGNRSSGPVCFETVADHEIAVDNRKLVGSAQMRIKGAVLQHGTLPLSGDITRICALLASPADSVKVLSRATTLERILSREVSWEEAATAMARGFSSALNVFLNPGELNPTELTAAAKLREEKYGAHAWNNRM